MDCRIRRSENRFGVRTSVATQTRAVIHFDRSCTTASRGLTAPTSSTLISMRRRPSHPVRTTRTSALSLPPPSRNASTVPNRPDAVSTTKPSDRRRLLRISARTSTARTLPVDDIPQVGDRLRENSPIDENAGELAPQTWVSSSPTPINATSATARPSRAGWCLRAGQGVSLIAAGAARFFREGPGPLSWLGTRPEEKERTLRVARLAEP